VLGFVVQTLAGPKQERQLPVLEPQLSGGEDPAQ